MHTEKKRLVGVLNCRHGMLVKSYGYALWRPSVSLESALRTLDRWHLDEIVILDISRKGSLDQSIIDRLKVCSISTPVAYGGGIQTVGDLETLSKVGCDRFVVESALFESPEAVKKMVSFVGKQAIIGSLPVNSCGDRIEIWNSSYTKSNRTPSEVAEEWLSLGLVSEVLVTSVESEGSIGRFPIEITSMFEGVSSQSIIWFGGIDTDRARTLLNMNNTSAVAIGNILHEREISMPLFRNRINKNLDPTPVRETRN
jgi:imidazole glycerol phosphate synthase subunit HisF